MACELTPDHVMDAVDRIMSARWQWGVSDCSVAAADVFLDLHGIDLAGRYRGTYADAVGAMRVIRSWGGFLSMTEQLAQINRLSPSNGAPGDIGISAHGVGSGPEGRSMLICVQPGIWAGKTLYGYAIVKNAARSWCVSYS